MQGEMKFPQLTQYKNAFHKSSIKGQFFWLLTPMLSYLLIVLLISSSNVISAQDLIPPQAATAQTTIAIFTDSKAPPISEGLWQSLVTAIREELASGSPETQALATLKSDQNAGSDTNAQIQIIRGDQVVRGLKIDNSITVYLHADCKIVPHPARLPLGDPAISGVLGWVLSDHGHIAPFIHVDCARLGQMLATRAFGCNRDQRDQLLGNAIARVILHEWIHIATQNPSHAERGIAKAQFSVVDLLARVPQSSGTPSLLRRRGTE
jgi:hypothetical protein